MKYILICEYWRLSLVLYVRFRNKIMNHDTVRMNIMTMMNLHLVALGTLANAHTTEYTNHTLCSDIKST